VKICFDEKSLFVFESKKAPLKSEGAFFFPFFFLARRVDFGPFLSLRALGWRDGRQKLLSGQRPANLFLPPSRTPATTKA